MDDLTILRRQIDEVDERLLQLIGKRLAIMQSIGEIKKNSQSQIRDHKRENDKTAHLIAKGAEVSIPKEIIQKIWSFFFELAELIER